MSDSEINVSIAAQFSKLLEGLDKATAGIQSSTSAWTSQFKGLSAVVGMVEGAFVALAAAIAGGAVLGQAIEVVTEGVDQLRLFGQELGLASDEAAGLNDALEDIGSSSDAYLGAVTKLTRQIRSNEDQLRALGLQTRDTSGNLRESRDLFFDAIGILDQYKAGTDRNAVASLLFGRSIRDVQALMRLNRDDIEASTEKMRAWGLVVGQEDVEASYRFKRAQEDVKDVGEAVGKVVGQALLPTLSQLGEWFGQTGPAMVVIFRVALATLMTPIVWLIGTLREVYDVASFTFPSIGILISRVAEATSLAMKGDFAGAVKTIKDGFTDIGDRGRRTWQDMIADAQKASAEINRLWSPNSTIMQPGGGDKAAPNFEDLKNSTSSGTKFDILKAQLEQWKEDQGQLLADLTKQEIAYWSDALARARGDSELERKIKHEMYALQVADAKNSLNDELAAIKQQAMLVRDNYAQRIQLATQAAQRIGEAYGMESAEYKKALAEIAALAMQERDRQLRYAQEEIEASQKHAASLIAIQQSHLDTRHGMQVMSDSEYLGEVAKLHEQEYQLELKSLQDKLTLLDTWSEEYRRVLGEIATLQDKHALDMAKTNDEMMASTAKNIEGMLTPLTNSIASAATGIAQGTLTMRKAVANTLNAMVAEFISMVARRSVTWIAGELALTKATTLGVAARTSAEQAGAGASMLMMVGRIIRRILNYAVETFGGIFAFLSGAMGPAAAGPAAAGAAVVAGSAVGVLAARQGFEVPAGSSPITRLHEKEMVLPADIATPMRDMLAGGGGGGGINVTIHAVDAKGVRDLFTKHGSELVRALRQQGRGFAV